MKPAIKYLDEAKQRLGSDYAVARAIGVMPGAISNARNRASFGWRYARKLAPIIDRDVVEMMDALTKHREAGTGSFGLIASIATTGITAAVGGALLAAAAGLVCILCPIEEAPA